MLNNFFSFTILSLFLFSHGLIAGEKDGYNIKLRVKGVSDTICFLANYYGDKQYIQDTVKADLDGKFTFQGEEKMPGGIYLVILPRKKYFEILLDKEQNFSIETDTADLAKNMVIKGSPENKLFYEYLGFITEKGKEAEPLRTLQKSTKNKDSIADLSKKLRGIDEEVKNYKLNFMKKNPKSFLAKIFKTSSETEIPDAPKLENGKTDSLFSFRFYKQHFFDSIDFSDERILRTPIFHGKIKQYIQNLTVQHPDSVAVAADLIIGKAKANKEIFKYCVWYVTYTYETSNLMGSDAVFVHMAEKYYMTNQAYWVDSTTLSKITNRARTLKPLLIGKKAPPLNLTDSTGKIIPLYSINSKFTIVFFWDPNCGHCKKTTPVLKEFFTKNKSKGIEIYAVCTETNEAEWKKYINDNGLADWKHVADPKHQSNFRKNYDIYSTPVIYLLNDKKEIIAKRIGVEQLENFINDKKEIGVKTVE